jgi:predicted nucleic acid-binding Zn ribbon protein
MNYCTSCGTELEPDNRFCTNCGAKVSAASNQQTDENGTSALKTSNSSTEKLRIDIIGSTIIGLMTFSIWWTFKLKKWSEIHLKYYEDKYANSNNVQSSEILNIVKQSTNRTVQLSMITAVLLFIGVSILILSFFWEVVLDLGGFPLPEGPFWFYFWLSLSMLAISWASVLFSILKVLELRSSKWLPLGGSSGIIVTTVIWCIVALGVLPLAIFPPIASGSVNKYVSILTEF